MPDFKIYTSNLRRHKKAKITEQFTYVRVNLIYSPLLISGKLPKLKKANRSINTRKVSFVL